MARILNFRTESRSTLDTPETADSHEAALESRDGAEIVLFPGIRYEREPSCDVRPPRQRDWLVLNDVDDF